MCGRAHLGSWIMAGASNCVPEGLADLAKQVLKLREELDLVKSETIALRCLMEEKGMQQLQRQETPSGEKCGSGISQGSKYGVEQSSSS